MKNPKTSTGIASPVSSLRQRLSRLLLPAALLGLAAAPLFAATEMKSGPAGKVIKEAKAAAAKGDSVKARELYQLVAASTPKAPKQRAEALYELLLLEAAMPAASRDRAALEASSAQFLQQFPAHEKRPVVAAMAGLLADTRAKDEEIAALEAKIAAAELTQKEASAAGAKDASKKVDELEAKLRRSGAEVELLKAELAKKEEALKKLKKVVVGGG